MEKLVILSAISLLIGIVIGAIIKSLGMTKDGYYKHNESIINTMPTKVVNTPILPTEKEIKPIFNRWSKKHLNILKSKFKVFCGGFRQGFDEACSQIKDK